MSTLLTIKRVMSYGALNMFSRNDSSGFLSKMQDERQKMEQSEDFQMKKEEMNVIEEETADHGLFSIIKEAWESPEQCIAMLSTFSTSYNAVNISMVLPIILVYHSNDNMDASQTGLCASSLLAGMIVGQLVGGWLGDKIGRVRALQIVMLLQLVASVGSAIIVPGDTTIDVMLNSLSTLRFVLGVGAGGVYPLAAVLSAEAKKSRKSRENQQQQERKLKMMSLVFSMQGVAFLCAPLITFFLLNIFPYNQLELVWRVVLGLGAIPSLFMMILGTPSDTEQGDDDIGDETATECSPLSMAYHNKQSHTTNGLSGENKDFEMAVDKLPAEDSNTYFVPIKGDGSTTVSSKEEDSIWNAIRSEPQVLRKLIGTALSWLFFDVLFYGNTLFQPIVLDTALGHNGNTNHLRSLSSTLAAQVTFHSEYDKMEGLLDTVKSSLFVTMMALPGYIFSFILMGKKVKFFSAFGYNLSLRQTPRHIQLQGFICMALLYSIIASCWNIFRDSGANNNMCKIWLVILYGGTFFFANYGPNTTTYLMPSLIFPRKCRSTLNGLSAAAGKLGAVLGASLFAPISNTYGDQIVMAICALISIIGVGITYLCIPNKMK